MTEFILKGIKMVSGNSASEVPVVSRIDDGAIRFVLSMEQAFLAYLFMQIVKLDVKGAIKAGQVGRGFLSSQKYLQNGISAYLASKGYKAPQTTALKLRLLATIFGDKNEIYKEAHDLVYANPEQPREVNEFADRCISFIEERLGMKWLWQWGSFDDVPGYRRYCLAFQSFARYLDSIGIAYTTIAPMKELERQSLWQKKLAPSLYQ